MNKKLLLEIYDFVAFVIFAAGIIFFIKFFILTPFTVVWHSMEPNIHNGDFLIVDEITPKIKKELSRWQIIIFAPPGKDIDYIKRIIGLPWDIVKIMSGSVYICHRYSTGESCNKLSEPYLPESVKTKAKCWINTFYVESGTYFVLGDNREHSTDSRCCFGQACYSGASYLVPKENIIWIPRLRISWLKVYFYK